MSEKRKNFDEDPLTSLRSGNRIPKIFPKIVKKILIDRALKFKLLALFCRTAFQYFYTEIEAGNAIYFRIGGKQDSKLWSADNFKREGDPKYDERSKC